MIERLKDNIFLKRVKEETLEQIISLSSPLEKHPAKKMLMEPASEEKDIFFVLSGGVRISLISAEGDVVSYNDIHAQDCFGWLSILDEKERLTLATTTEKTETIKIKGEAFKSLLYTDNQLLDNFMIRIASVVRSYTERIEGLSVLSVRERIINELLRRSRKHSSDTIKLGTHEDFASWLGIKRETVTRALKELETAGTIKKSENGYQILD